jgi:parvulin-like peptidyl-prolyl isomerase
MSLLATPTTLRRLVDLFLLVALAASTAALSATTLSADSGSTRRRDKSPVLVTVNGTPITENQAALYRLLHRLPDDPSPEARRKVVEQLVDNELMRQLLLDRRAEPDPKRLAAGIEALKADLRKRDKGSSKNSKLEITDAALRRELFVPLAWEYHLGRVLTQTTLQEEFERHRAEYDGTEVRASQIFIKVAPQDPPEKAKEAEQKLASLRAEIARGKMSFADAASKYSEAPSAGNGGDVGYFPFRGPMPADVCRAVFALKQGEVSQPFRTPFGVHLYTVTEIRPGNLSLEDVRSPVIRRVASQLWDQLVAQARKTAKIEWQSAGGA